MWMSLLFLPAVLGQISLPRLNIDVNGISVSGISSGACFATQFHVAYSAIVMGMGMNAGAPYYCAEGSSITAINRCMNNPNNVDVSVLRAQAETYASDGDIDPTSNIMGDKIAIFHGSLDNVVNIGASYKTDEFYSAYANSADVDVTTNLPSDHGFPTLDYGIPCATTGSPYINKCNYDGAFYFLNHIYGGNLQQPKTGKQKQGTLEVFDQSEFFTISLPSQSSMDREGYVYIPDACDQGQQCKLHVVFHGCLMGKGVLENEFALHAGYNEVADANNIVILYPQAIRSFTIPNNPNGCWDWWGYTIRKYATQGANQPLAVARMVKKMSGLNLTANVDKKYNI